MNLLNNSQSVRLSRTKAWLATPLLVAGLALQGCGPGAPKGQVVASVNGQEITYHDLSAEARADRVERADPKVLLQKVVSRVLLAQDAHARGLDRYADYPSDIARVQQSFLVQRELQTRVKPPETQPSSADIRAFMDAHPYIFADRMRIQLDELQFQGGDAVKGLDQLSGLSAVADRLKSLSVPFDRKTNTIDTADLPPALAQRFIAATPGQLTFVKSTTDTIATVVKGRAPVVLPEDQATALATKLLGEASVQRQVGGLVDGLKGRAKIVYQKGFSPPAPGPAATPTKPG